MMYIIVAIIGLAGGLGIAILRDYLSTRSSLPRQKFRQEKSKVLKDLKEKKDAFDKEMTQEALIQQEKLRQEITKLQLQQEAEKQSYISKKQTLEDSYKNEERRLQIQYEKDRERIQHELNERQQAAKDIENSAAAARQAESQARIQKEQEALVEKLNLLREDYKEKKGQLDQDFFTYSELITMKKATLENELKEYEDRQMAVIARFKADEEKKNNLDFYRIKLTESEVEDVKKLRQIAVELHNPTILYKLIWENYYKSKFSELVGRVAPNKIGCGIYKITNINNGKVYVGQTRQSFNDRWRSHVRKGLRAEPTTNNKLYNAMWEEGPESFTFEIITQCQPEELDEKEKYFIEFYKGSEWGYNSTKGNSK